MNTCEPVIAFIEQRIIDLRKEVVDAKNVAKLDVLEARFNELKTILNLCTGLIAQDKLLQNALASKTTNQKE